MMTTRRPRTTSAILSATVAAAFCGLAAAQHLGDIALAIEEASPSPSIATGAYDPLLEAMVPQRVFGGLFGDSGFPGFTANPGFDAPSGTFMPGTRVGFDALAGVRRFDGDDLVPATGAFVEMSFLTLATTIGDEPTPGFDLAVASSGGFHRHFNFTLGAAGGGLPAPGVYVLELSLYSTEPGLDASEPFWIAFGHEVSTTDVEDATEWIEANLIDPACPGDLDGDGTIGGGDLAVLLAGWGGEAPDLDGDGVVGGSDLAVLLSSWGEACGP
jgi:hypothetical protein